ncbi:murein peptide amidase A [Microbulbifer aestuariivivens]|uniref:Murein peptide amidase A n=1 Tax=Microbulbifer aestuariivivens TaxID=1908308 RepID=A0ABP9WP50_9GAMM
MPSNPTLSTMRPRPDRGQFSHHREVYGRSVLGAPLLYFPAQGGTRKGLIIAGTHGDETAAVIALSCALRALPPEQLNHHVVLAVNPDGCQLGLRANANGVDLNRNFATANWSAEDSVYRWNSQADERDVRLKTGSRGGSEPETEALCQLIEKLSPAWVVTIHEPLACIEDPDESPLANWLSERLKLPLVSELGYPTPGSFGSWCAERNLPCITVEFPPISADLASEDYLPTLFDLLSYEIDESAG